jgi:hypothetical protein
MIKANGSKPYTHRIYSVGFYYLIINQTNMNYTWKTFKQLKGRITKNKTRMLYDHLTTSGAILLTKVKNMYELSEDKFPKFMSRTIGKMNEVRAKCNNHIELEVEALEEGEDFDAKNFERE